MHWCGEDAVGLDGLIHFPGPSSLSREATLLIYKIRSGNIQWVQAKYRMSMPINKISSGMPINTITSGMLINVIMTGMLKNVIMTGIVINVIMTGMLINVIMTGMLKM